MSGPIDTSSIIKQLETIQAMVICSRAAVERIGDDDALAAANLLNDASGRIEDIKFAIDPDGYGEAKEGGKV